MSSALASLSAPEFFSSAAAMASKHSFFSRVVSFASSRDAALACLASCVICSVRFMAEIVTKVKRINPDVKTATPG